MSILEEVGRWSFAVAALIVARSAIASPHHVPTGSMEPTIGIGDHILVDKLAYGLQTPWLRFDVGEDWYGSFTTKEVVRWGEPDRGDIVLLRPPHEPGKDYVKRVIAVPGDEVELVGNVVRVNDVVWTQDGAEGETFVDSRCTADRVVRRVEHSGGVDHDVYVQRRHGRWANFGPVTVPPGKVFVMGDNRDHSADSRYFGMVDRDDVRGKAVVSLVSFDLCNGGLDGEPHLLH